MTNFEIADHFSLLSKLMDIHGEDSFKSKSYSIAAYNIEQLPTEASSMTTSELQAAKGIGASTGKKIAELLETGKLTALEDVVSRTPPGILDMLQVKGMGPKKIATVWKELEIETVGELEYACNENRLVTLKGFGAKTQQSILESIAYIRQNQGFYLWKEANEIANLLVRKMQATLPSALFAIVGELRRQNETVNRIEVVTTVRLTDICDMLVGDQNNQLLTNGDTLQVINPSAPTLLFYHSNADTFYKCVFERTGSNAFLEAFLQNYELPAAPLTEEAIFEQNHLQYIPPAQREEGTILDPAKSHLLPSLITMGEIRGIVHTHSKWSDGQNSVREMAQAAIEHGFEYLVMSDHSQSAYYAGGLTPERVAAQHIEIDALNNELAPFKIFKSIESDILSDGSLDYCQQVLSTFDLVIVSVHSNLRMSQEKAMERLLNAIANPYTTILGHMTGRLLLSRAGYPIDHKKIIEACAKFHVAIEINAHPRRLDLDWRWIPYAIECGVLLSINPDAHSTAGFTDVHYGATVAQKGGLTPRWNLSSYTLAEFEDYLARNKEAKKVVAFNGG
jgi:DNA polymerase (family X)